MASPSPGADGITGGFARPQTAWGQYNNIYFAIQQALAKMQTATLVRVETCTNDGGLSPVGFVDVTPLVSQIDAQGNPTPHTIIHNLPYLRMQGGGNAVIIDPEPGDIGICVFASRDISKVKSTKTQATPGSLRQYSFSDGLYIGGVLNAEPGQYIQFNTNGIRVFSPLAVVIEAPNVEILAETVNVEASESVTITTPTFTVNGNTTLNGTVEQTGGGNSTFSGDVTAQGTSVHTHVHGGVQPGGGNTGQPV